MTCKEEFGNGSFCRLDSTTPDGYCRWHFLSHSYLVQLPLGPWALFPALVIACWAGVSAFNHLVQFAKDFDVVNGGNAIEFGGLAMISTGYGMLCRGAREIVWPRIMNWGMLLVGVSWAGTAIAHIVTSKPSQASVAFWVHNVGFIIGGVLFAGLAVIDGKLVLPKWKWSVVLGVLLVSIVVGRMLAGASVGQILIWCAVIGWYVELQYGLIRRLFKSF